MTATCMRMWRLGGLSQQSKMPLLQGCCSTVTTQVEYNLYGMGFIRLRKARFRGQLPARGRAQRAGWSAVAEVLTYEEASTGEVPDDSLL